MLYIVLFILKNQRKSLIELNFLVNRAERGSGTKIIVNETITSDSALCDIFFLFSFSDFPLNGPCIVMHCFKSSNFVNLLFLDSSYY